MSSVSVCGTVTLHVFVWKLKLMLLNAFHYHSLQTHQQTWYVWSKTKRF